MFMLLSGVPPFNGKSDEQILQAVVKGNYEFIPSRWKDISDDAKDLIK